MSFETGGDDPGWQTVSNQGRNRLDDRRLEDARAKAISTWKFRLKVVLFCQLTSLLVFLAFSYVVSSFVTIGMLLCGVMAVYSKAKEATFAYLVLVPLNAVKDFVVTLEYSPTGFLLGIQMMDLIISLVAAYIAFFLYKSLNTSRLVHFQDSNSGRDLGPGGFEQNYAPPTMGDSPPGSASTDDPQPPIVYQADDPYTNAM
eukprot:gb/GEZN01018771.1/.p1 GENE.gb/GEZN01018771.1/~~gb/GEZN01018771.1/.p1  ORF type:complete len:201 (-),score=29.62 gb/GEZN01018771.1/:73-675(-)